MTHLISRFVLLVSLVTAMFGLTPTSSLGQGATPVAGALPDGVTIVANGLDNPRNFT
jgi:hypothetical protein